MPLPALREELALHVGPPLADGQPSWTLHDPVRNRFFRIDWLTFEILGRWSLGDARRIAAEVRAASTLQPDATDLQAVERFLVDNELVSVAPGGAQRLADRLRRERGDWRQWLLHHYLFFRIPLLRPDRWLDRWAGVVAPLYSRGFLWATLVALLIGCIEVARDWTQFSTTLVDTLSVEGLVGYGAALAAVKLLHELGHAFTAKRFGCRVPAMGVAMLVMFPVAYTDTNEVWKLADRRQRLAVAGAGVATEGVIAAWATLAWALLPEGHAKAVAFMLATTTWIATLAVNASPFMRFDGYFLLSDALDMPNLHQRAFALARWDLRERLFALGVPPPEYVAKGRHIGLVAFAWATWVYRLVVFLGIAALVYAFFIKAVGIMLFVVEIGWFLVLPVWSEVKLWPALLARRSATPTRRQRMRLRRSVLLAIVCVLLVVLPWPSRPSSAALLKPLQSFPFHAPAGAQIVRLPVADGAAVAAGQPLIEMTSPELELRWRRAQAHLASAQARLQIAGVDDAQRQNQQTLREEAAGAEAELASVRADMARYAPVAPFAGTLRDLEPGLAPGVWVGTGERLGLLVDPTRWQVETYLDEDAVRRIAVGDRARFLADGREGPALELQVDAIDLDATRSLRSTELALATGGSVPTRDRHGETVPDRAVYRVTLRGDDRVGPLADHTWRGHVVIQGRWEAPVLAYLRAALAMGWREMGF